jgi:hypothetical protein
VKEALVATVESNGTERNGMDGIGHLSTGYSFNNQGAGRHQL